MKSPLRVAFGISLAVHVVAAGLATGIVVALHRPTVPQEDPVITLTLIAAPAVQTAPLKVVTAIAPAPEVVEPAAVIPPELPPVPTQAELLDPIPTPTRTPAFVPVVQTEESMLPAKPAPAPVVRGDGSSPEPGLDAATVRARPEARAKPNYLKNPDPAYPPTARRRHQEGTVLLSVKVTAKGQPTHIAIKQSSGFTLLDEAALKAVRDWEFEPAKIGDVAIESEIEVPVRFELSK